jgi:hypothetical protein
VTPETRVIVERVREALNQFERENPHDGKVWLDPRTPSNGIKYDDLRDLTVADLRALCDAALARPEAKPVACAHVPLGFEDDECSECEESPVVAVLESGEQLCFSCFGERFDEMAAKLTAERDRPLDPEPVAGRFSGIGKLASVYAHPPAAGDALTRTPETTDAEQVKRVARAITDGAEGLPPQDYRLLAECYLAAVDGNRPLAEEVARRAMVEQELRKEIESLRAAGDDARK